jgi:hypothetical protein
MAPGVKNMDQPQPVPSKRKTALALLAWALLPLSIFSVIMWQFCEWEWPLKRDPIEFNPFIQSDFRAAEREAEELLKNDPTLIKLCSRGRQNIYWQSKQAILGNKYGITWRTPAEMNPGKFH